LDLFLPYEYGYDFKVVVTNKTLRPTKVVTFHEGRGSQEGIFGELKTDRQMGYIPVKNCLPTFRSNRPLLAWRDDIAGGWPGSVDHHMPSAAFLGRDLGVGRMRTNTTP
jgi:hypothetical protein